VGYRIHLWVEEEKLYTIGRKLKKTQ
jgi:hypothetical protein